MKILFCGDVVGKSGRQALKTHLPKVCAYYQPDALIINGENAAHGFGITPKIFSELKSLGADIITLGNHTFDKTEVHGLLQEEPSLVRPLNYPEGTLGQGFYIHTLQNGGRLAVVQLIGRTFMRPVDDPFECINSWLKSHLFGRDFDALVIDFHAEATAEKRALGAFLDGKASAVLGTHTHIPTADAFVLPGGTAYQTDVGMCGDYLSIIGMRTQDALPRFLGEQSHALAPAEGTGTFCATYLETDNLGRTIKITPIILGGCLQETSLGKGGTQ